VTKLFLIVPFVCLLAACSKHSSPGLSAADVIDAEVLVIISPGKPDTLAESITIGKHEDACSVVVKQIDSAGNALMEERAPLPTTAFDQLWDVIEAGELRTMNVKVGPEKPSDFGEVRIHLEWKKTGGGDVSEERELVWNQPLVEAQQAKVDRFFSKIAALAKNHAKTIQLQYFPAN
jgi:hypothetical protein